MFKNIFNFLSDKAEESDSAIKLDKYHNKKLQIATCALFLELANADDEFIEEEKNAIINVMKEIFQLSDKLVNELIELSEEQRNKSVSLYEFTEVINDNFSKDEKYEVLKNLWRLIYVDEKLHAYEDHFIRKISGNLKFSHSEMIAAKLEIKEELK